MCKTLNCTPSELGQARKRNSKDIEFLERSYIRMKEREMEAMKESERKAKSKRKIR